MNYKEAMNYIDKTAKFGIKLGLERTERMLELLNSPHKKTKFIHIAGTNGKGSTTAMLSNILIKAGYKVGMYTSPYIEEFEERIQINNKNIPKDKFAAIVTDISEVVNKVIEDGYGEPTYFELITCAGFLYFYREKVDFAVIEVGMGGRLDSTNVITPILSIITSISLDHTHVLGDTLEKIAFEKGGIIKANIPVVVYPQVRECEEVIRNICNERKSKLIEVSKETSVCKGIKEYDNVPFQLLEVNTEFNKYNIELSLLGKHQLLNCTVVINAVEELIKQGIVIENKHIKEALRGVKWPGRLETLNNPPKVVIDGAHNIDAITNLSENVKKYFKYDKLILILGILSDKQVDEMISTIVPLADKVIAVTPHSDRAKLAVDLQEKVKIINSNCEAVDDYYEAFKKAFSYCSKNDMLLITGSLYMIGDMRRIIRKHFDK